MRLAAVAFWIVLIGAMNTSQAATCVTDVSLIDVDAGQVVEGVSIAISGNLIDEVSASMEESECTTSIDGSGKYLMPGLWDMHVHGTHRGNHWPVYVANGVTGYRDLFGFLGDPPVSEGADLSLQPQRYSAGPIIDGPPGIWPGSQIATNAEEARQIVAEQYEAGVDFLKVYALLSADAYAAIFTEAAKYGLPVAGHVPLSSSAQEASMRGQRTIEHLDNIPESCAADEAELRARPVRSFVDSIRRARDAYDTFDLDKCQALADTFKANDTWMVPTLSVMLGSAVDATHAANVEKRKAYFDDDTLQWLVPRSALPADGQEILNQAFLNSIEYVRFLNAEGVRFLAGTDVMNPNTFPGFAIHDELELLVRAGFSNVDAIRAATISPAVFLGREDEIGSVDVGKIADLVLLDANPLDDIRNTTRIHAVFMRGEYFSRERLDELLQSVRSADASD